MQHSSSGSNSSSRHHHTPVVHLNHLNHLITTWRFFALSTALPIIGFILFNISALAFLSSPPPAAVGEDVNLWGWGFIARFLLLSTNTRHYQQSESKKMDVPKKMDSIRDTKMDSIREIILNEDDEKLAQNFAKNFGLSEDHHGPTKHSPRASLDNDSNGEQLPKRLPNSYNGRNSLFFFSKVHGDIPSHFSLDSSTQENYGVENKELYGKFREVRAGLDYAYHGNYSKTRQEFQDKIIEKLLDGAMVHDSTNGMVCKTPTEPWILFTAGVMGAGKSHTMKQVASKGCFPLKSYVIVDPDEIRSHFPEYHLYASHCPNRAGELTHREAGYVTEIITAVALQKGYNVLVDGSLKDYKWYQEYFTNLRKEYPVLRIAILHIIAPRKAIFERAKKRAKDTGRVVPIETLEESLKQVPISVKKLAPMADFFCELDNSPTLGEVTLKTDGITWDLFRDNWAQTCPWVPGQHRGKM